MTSTGEGAVDQEAMDRAEVRRPWMGYQVSAPHRVLVGPGDEADWRPFGTWHARRLGAPWTACGKPAALWRTFWNLTFDSPSANICGDCRSRVGQRHHRGISAGS